MAARRKRDHTPLLMRVCAALGDGKITEAWIADARERVSGLTQMDRRRHITINPAWETVDTVVHELLHRLEPAWSENYVRNRTSYLMRRMTDAEVQAIYREYQARARKRQTKVTCDD